jgi:hypothetical protein
METIHRSLNNGVLLQKGEKQIPTLHLPSPKEKMQILFLKLFVNIFGLNYEALQRARLPTFPCSYSFSK